MQASKFQIECSCPSGKLIVKITCPNVPITCMKYIKPMQLMWKSKIHSRPSDKSCSYSICLTVISTHLRRSDEWNFEPCYNCHSTSEATGPWKNGYKWHLTNHNEPQQIIPDMYNFWGIVYVINDCIDEKYHPCHIEIEALYVIKQSALW